MCGDKMLSEDITQEVFYKLMKYRASYNNGKFVSWLFTIARNTLNTHFRRAANNHEDIEALDQKHITIDEPNTDYSDLHVALQKLDVSDRELIILNRFQEIKYAELAEIVGKLLPDYLDSLLTETQNQEVESHLADCNSCSIELKELESIIEVINNESRIVPSESLRSNFYKQLELEKQNSSKTIALDTAYKQKKHSWTNNLLKIAASFILLVGDVFFRKATTSRAIE
ncbi:ECF RNA polymerase sigma factor SigE [Nymphon striatum]|nr:ECF RNA polymerase sigma factor SigE [Nymphon striatum]